MRACDPRVEERLAAGRNISGNIRRHSPQPEKCVVAEQKPPPIVKRQVRGPSSLRSRAPRGSLDVADGNEVEVSFRPSKFQWPKFRAFQSKSSSSIDFIKGFNGVFHTRLKAGHEVP